MGKCNCVTLRRYYRSIREQLPCTKKEKDRILSEIKTSISSYLEEHPLSDIAQVQAHFGSPQQIASGYIDALNSAEMLHALKLRKRILITVGAVALAMLLLWAGVLTWAAIEANDSNNGYYVDEIRP